jgi:putative transposase
MTTRRVNALNGTPSVLLWQRNYHDRIVRDEKALDNIRRYILDYPVQWPLDDENPLR